MLMLEAELSSAQSKEGPLDGWDTVTFVVIPAGGIVLDGFLIQVTIFGSYQFT